MKIGIDIRSTLKRKTGIGYYTLNLLSSLAAADAVNSYRLYSDVGFFSRNKSLPPLPGRNFRHCINRFKLDPGLALKGVEVFHTQSYDLLPRGNIKTVQVVHDVMHRAYPVGQDKESMERTEEGLKRSLDRAYAVVASSIATREDIIRFYGLDAEKIKVVYPGFNRDLFELEGLNKDDLNKFFSEKGINKPYILYVGTLEPRKNVENLIRGYHILRESGLYDHQLVVAGMKGWGFEKIFGLVDEYGLDKEVVFTGYVERRQLKALYENADVFIYPSFYEGVGLPILEAFSFGLAVVTSNVSSLSEIGGDAAALIDPDKPQQICDALRRIIEDPVYKAGLKEKALKRAKVFSWKDAAERTLEIFDGLR